MTTLVKYNHSLILFLIFSISSALSSAQAEDNPNTITFENESGEPAVVKLVGPSDQSVEVSQGESRTVNVAAGKYHILVRYGSKGDQYTYSKGDPFTVEQTATQYSAISITLHKVVDGNYATHPTSRAEFDQVPAKGKATDKSSTSPKKPFTMDIPSVSEGQ